MKTWKLVSGILSIVLFLVVAFQSCAAGVVDAIAGQVMESTTRNQQGWRGWKDCGNNKGGDRGHNRGKHRQQLRQGRIAEGHWQLKGAFRRLL